ncbi:hypothetical protein TELCIR_07376 [Teladorsagia circumcincta]|uniref:Major facilitator superfamily (MFS) profile domain-containing protein n=1 Tax=Teladorsagia circumcincta TaxID=45464 RepID=A0A2G9UKI8_TELCI|nr:hypothetical protein TELCIR_07376 [Teladorsagia circumcincta]
MTAHGNEVEQDKLDIQLTNMDKTVEPPNPSEEDEVEHVQLKFSMVYMICTIPVGFFAMWAGRRFGLRSAIMIAAYRIHRQVAGSWFPDTQRGLATTIGIMSNPLGVLLANVISPQMVRAPQHIVYLNIFTFVPAFAAMILATFAVKSSEPKIPPTFSASKPQMDFFPGLKACMMSKQYLILFIVMGGGIGMFNCLYTIMQGLLCPSGYSNSFVGMCAALMIIGGIIGAAGSGMFVDRTKMYEETMKVSMGLAVVFGLIFMQVEYLAIEGFSKRIAYNSLPRVY